MEPLKSDRLRKTVEVLSKLDLEALRLVVWRRLKGEHEVRDLPPLARDEYPADLFVDYVAYCDLARKRLADLMREASSALLADPSIPPSPATAAALDELAYLAARISARAAIDPLAYRIQFTPDDLKMPDHEPLRVVFLRALLGLLGRFHTHLADTEKYRGIFEHNLTLPGCQVLCLTALAGLWPPDLSKYQAVLRAKNYEVPESGLSVALQAAGFQPLPAPALT